MATLTGSTVTGHRSVGSGAGEPRANRATGSRPTGPDLLVSAAAVLPMVVGRGPVRCVDVHTSLYEAACVRGMGRDRPHRLRLADEAFDRFAVYLLASGETADEGRSSDTVRGWLLCPDQLTYRGLPEVQLALAAAGGHRRPDLAAPGELTAPTLRS